MDVKTPPTGSGNAGDAAEKPLLGYASGLHVPAGAGDPGGGGEAYSDAAGTLVVRYGTTLLERCVLCGDPAEGAAIRLTLTWDSTFRMTTRSTLELRKQANVYAFLCRRHRTKWSGARFWGGVGSVSSLAVLTAGLATGVLSESSDIPEYTPLGIALVIAGFTGIIISLFFFTLQSRTLSCRRIEEGYLYLDGAGDEFLRHLPTMRPAPNAPLTKT